MAPRVVHTFGAFHYDVAYQKTFEGYLPKSFAAIEAGLDLLAKHRDYVFVIEQVILVREYLRRNPGGRARMRRFAKEGRLLFAPGMFTMPDLNLPSGECFVRNFQIGREWLRRELGVEPKICWMADIFGHPPQTPQLARLCGYDAYMFERGRAGGEEALFWWRGLDGSRILTQWEVDTYYGVALFLSDFSVRRDDRWAFDRTERAILDPLAERTLGRGPLLSAMGGDFRKPDAADLDVLRRHARSGGRYRVRFHSPEKHFADILARPDPGIPEERAEFNPLMQGVFSSRIRLKQMHRRLESLAFALDLLTLRHGGAAKDSADLWEALSWNAFHDIICGTLEDRSYREALRLYVSAERRAEKALLRLATRCSQPAPDRKGGGLSVFNSLPYAREEVVDVPASVAGETRAVRVKTPPSSMTPVAACTIAVPRGDAARARANLLENRLLRAEFAADGTIRRLIDRESGARFGPFESRADAPGMLNFVRQSDGGDLWSHYRRPINGSLLYTAPLHDPRPISSIELVRQGGIGCKGFDAEAMELPVLRVIESGPVRATIEIARREPELTTRVSLCAGEKMLRFATRFVPRGRHYRLRVAFPTGMPRGRRRFSVPCGFTTRPEGEYAAQGWVDYSDGRKGLCLLNRGLPGVNVTDGVMMLSLFRAVAMDSVDRRPWYEEGVKHLFEYALLPFDPRDRSYLPERLAARFNNPVRLMCAPTGRTAPEMASLLSLDGDGAELMGLRRLDDAVELRLCESAGRRSEVTLTLAAAPVACVRTDFRGVAVAEQGLTMSGREVRLKLRPFEIVALRIAWET